MIDLQESDTWKIHLTSVINFISSKDAEEERVMRTKSNDITFTYYKDANEVVDEFFDSLRSRYQDNLEKLNGGSEFIFYSVQLIHYKCHTVHFIRGGSYIDSPDWKKNGKSKNKSKK